MNPEPENEPLNDEPNEQAGPRTETELSAEEILESAVRYSPQNIEEIAKPSPAAPAERLLFASWTEEETHAPRMPHVGHLLVLGVLAFAGLACVALLARGAVHIHLFGVSKSADAVSDIHYMLGSMAALYLVTFGLALLDGLQWRARTALHLRGRLIGAAGVCFVLALIDGALMPGPENTPIDKIFRTPGAAWLLFFFGITFAPFFEEIVFRGFLLPAVCTAYDWAAEWVSGAPSRGSDENGHPVWSIPAMVAGSILVSLPFAWMHGEQTGYAVGPQLLLVCVSLVLCWARLSTRSLAASVLVHASYNFLLFFLMLLGTSGFKHIDKM